MTPQKHIGTKIPYDLWKAFVLLLRKKDMKISNFLRASVKNFVEENKEELSQYALKL